MDVQFCLVSIQSFLTRRLDHAKYITGNKGVYYFLGTPSFSYPLNAADAYLSMRER
jgi:hypothetical protein